ncbi:MAG: NCS2 family permease [Phycisphaerae bacterium]
MFQIADRGSTPVREVLGGLTTFLAMSYILFVQVGLLSGVAGMDAGGVLMAVTIASAAACILMGLLANYPIALAPGMGQNFFFLSIAMTLGAGQYDGGWQKALALVVVAGAVFLALATVGLRSKVLNSIPDALKSGIAAGIGLLIARVGFSMGGLEHAFDLSGEYGSGVEAISAFWTFTPAWLTLLGLLVMLVLVRLRVHGAILIGILAATGVSLVLGAAQLQAPFALPGGIQHTAAGAIEGFGGLWNTVTSGSWGQIQQVLILLFILLFMDLFDTVGTLVGVTRRAGLMTPDGHLPRAERALTADAAGTVIGGMLGTSTVTSYIESVTGVEAGARTGLAAIVTGVLMLAGMFCLPLVEIVMGEYYLGADRLFPTVAPALILVGAMMVRAIREVDFEDVTEYLPVLVILITMPLTMSIAHGIAFGFVAYAAGKLLTGKVRDCPLLVYLCAALFVLRYAWPVF